MKLSFFPAVRVSMNLLWVDLQLLGFTFIAIVQEKALHLRPFTAPFYGVNSTRCFVPAIQVCSRVLVAVSFRLLSAYLWP